MRRETHSSALATALLLKPTVAWLRWPCLAHEWIEVGRLDDLVCERCTRCKKDRQWTLPIDLDAP